MKIIWMTMTVMKFITIFVTIIVTIIIMHVTY